jgi:hypothetical protein
MSSGLSSLCRLVPKRVGLPDEAVLFLSKSEAAKCRFDFLESSVLLKLALLMLKLWAVFVENDDAGSIFICWRPREEGNIGEILLPVICCILSRTVSFIASGGCNGFYK